MRRRSKQSGVWMLVLVILALAGCSRTQSSRDWTPTATFDLPVTAADGTKFSYPMRGVVGQFAFIDMPFVAGKGQKYMWHFWGKPEDLAGKRLDVTAVSREGQRVQLFSGLLGGALNGAVAHTPSSMSLPSPGLWRLEVKVGGRILGHIVVEAITGS